MGLVLECRRQWPRTYLGSCLAIAVGVVLLVYELIRLLLQNPIHEELFHLAAVILIFGGLYELHVSRMRRLVLKLAGEQQLELK